jgi:8-oxo-dGTP diphosphatase
VTPDRPPAEVIRAAGAVVWRPAGRGARVVLVHRPKYDDWSLAKGKLEPSEHMLLAAVREVQEETGLRVRLGRRLPPTFYSVGSAPKRVDYWVATVEGVPAAFTPNKEVDAVAWVAARSAGARLTYQRDAETLAAFRAGPRQTAPLVLLRHASAGRKSDWPGDDMSRPLDAQGLLEAGSLAGLLRCFGTGRVVSAPAERCVATVRPYAAAIGADVEVEAAFDVSGGDGQGSLHGGISAAEKAATELASASGPIIICAHRENIPVLLAAACAAVGTTAPGMTELRKGEFLVLHRASGRLAAVERYHPDGALGPAELLRQSQAPGMTFSPADPWAASRASAAASLQV